MNWSKRKRPTHKEEPVCEQQMLSLTVMWHLKAKCCGVRPQNNGKPPRLCFHPYNNYYRNLTSGTPRFSFSSTSQDYLH